MFPPCQNTKNVTEQRNLSNVASVKKITSATELFDHIRTHASTNDAFKCNVCSKTFTSSSDLSEHKTTHMAVEKSFECDKCEEKFNSLTELTCHKITHTTTSASDLSEHEAVHTGKKPFKCNK